MKKRVFIVHGWGGSPNEPMHQWMKAECEKKHFEVIVPEMPNTEEPKIDPWVNTLTQAVEKPNEHTYFIGHGIGCQTILRYLQTLDPTIKIGGCILIAPWITLDKAAMEEEGEEALEIAEPWENTPIEWDAIKAHVDHFICIFSDNDPYVPLDNKSTFATHLPTKTIIEKGKGHFDPDSGVKDNLVAVRELLVLAKKHI